MSSPPESTALTRDESEELEVLEGVISAGLHTFIDVGNALLTIRARRLYRAEFPTFEGYCEARWEMSGRRARQIIDAAQNVADVQQVLTEENPSGASAKGQSGTAVPLLETEKSARPLSELDTPEEKAEAVKIAAQTAPRGKGGKPKIREQDTKAAVQQVKAKRASSTTPQTPAPEPSPEPTPAPAEPAPPPEPGARPFAAFNAQLDEINATIDAAADRLSRLCGFSKKQQHPAERFAAHISFRATVEALRLVTTHLDNMRPGEADGRGGFLRAEVVRNRKAVTASMR